MAGGEFFLKVLGGDLKFTCSIPLSYFLDLKPPEVESEFASLKTIQVQDYAKRYYKCAQDN